MVLAGSALAADLPVAKAPPAIVASSWAGFYLGIHGGYGWKQDDFSQPETTFFAAPQSINGIRSKGAVYGAQAGYNWQFGRIVTGLEIDFSATDIKGSNGVSEVLVQPVSDRGRPAIRLEKTSSISAVPVHVWAGCPLTMFCSTGPRDLRGSGLIRRKTVLR
jgi:opacity protein-like surface antigen